METNPLIDFLNSQVEGLVREFANGRYCRYAMINGKKHHTGSFRIGDFLHKNKFGIYLLDMFHISNKSEISYDLVSISDDKYRLKYIHDNILTQYDLV